MPTIEIDGRTIETEAGLTIIAVADRLDIEIPHYCYHPGLSIAGNCRMCLVEIERMPRLQIACNTPVMDGMVVRTATPKVEAARRAVLEFLLLNHPIDCPVCDQAGECKLQDYYMDYGRHPSRVPLEAKVRKGKVMPIGSQVVLDQERCILCGRCTRFFDEITRTSELAIFERGDHCLIDIWPGRPIDNKYAGNVIDICPVGALTEKDFRFRMRVWYLHQTPSVCGACERGCAIDIHHHRGRIYRFKPRYNPAVNGYWMCDEGRYSYSALQGEIRLTAPLVQSGDRLVREDWTSALRRVTDQIKALRDSRGAGSIGAVVGAHATNEEAYALKRLVRETVGSERLAGVSWSPPDASPDDDLLIRANKNPNTRGLRALGIPIDGLDALAQAVASGELRMLIALRADLVRILGEDDFLRRFGALDYLVVLDTHATETAQMANQVLPLAAYPELDGSFTNFKGRVQRLRQAFPPPGDARAAVQVLADLATALDGKEHPSTAQELFSVMAASEPSFRGLSLAGLGPHGANLSA
jgi:NADH-quinone oxidoreductase subunit G